MNKQNSAHLSAGEMSAIETNAQFENAPQSAPKHVHRSWQLTRHASALLISAGMLVGLTGTVLAAGEVSSIRTSEQLATPTRYTVDGTTYSWGMGANQVMDGFTSHSEEYVYATTADRVEIVRVDQNASTGNPCGVFVERLGETTNVLAANYPSDGSDTGNCDMAAMLASRVVNRGALNLFANVGPNPKNVERVDFLFDRGLLVPVTAAALSRSGHVMAEKRGNNALQMAAITAVDVFGQPTEYGPLVYVAGKGCDPAQLCYGVTNLRHNYSFFENSAFAPQGYPSLVAKSTESVGMAFISHERLGLSAGQVYYGFSYFANDVVGGVHNLTDVSSFPQDTNDEKIVFGDGADIYGGVSGYYLAESLNVISGAVFKDENLDGEVNDNEAGISDIQLTLYADSNGNGVYDPGIDEQVGSSINTDVSGEFIIPGVDDGIYFLLLDESDPDLPPGISVPPGTNPVMILINGADEDGVNFAFENDTDSGGDTGGSDTGDSDAGADAGGSDAGADAGESDAGADAGGSDAGADAGGSDAGADAGGSDAGADAGGSDAGADAGGSDAGADAGGSDAGTDAGSDAGGDTGGTDSGADDGGNFIPINDGVNDTVAHPDMDSVLQGSEDNVIDVLANDTDSPGDGLTIISTTESPNSSIQNLGTHINYTPEFGFIGIDTFLYVIEDAAGNQSTGTVSVDVKRFSDINNNNENDFDECNCDNLTIEVGVEGSALGATSLLFFLVLSWLYGFRNFVQSRRYRLGRLNRTSGVA